MRPIVGRSRIEICGGIASGKTTLCEIISFRSILPVYENFHGNPFWAKFYQDPLNYAFETETTFLLQHYSQIKENLWTDIFVCDFSVLQDIAYADLNLTGRHKQVFNSVYKFVAQELAQPTLVIHLKCDPEIELARVRKRARPEEAVLEAGYLRRLNAAIERNVKKMSALTNVLAIDSGTRDFAHDRQTQDFVVDMVLRAL